MFHVKRPAGRGRWHLAATGGVLATCALSVSGCVGPPAAEWADASADVECPVTPSDADGRIRIGYLGSPGADLYTQDQGLAEACLPNAEVSWTRFPTGQDIVQGFASDSVDIAGLGSTPTTKALSAPLNLPVSVVGVNSVIGTSEALVAKKAQTISELKGKRIAVPFSSTSHYSLLNALIDNDLDPAKDVTIVNISPDKLPAAWKSDQIDAAYVWDPTLQELKDGTGGSPVGNVLTDSEQQAAAGHPTYNVSLAADRWADSHAELLSTFLTLEGWVVDHADNDLEGFASVNAAASGMDEDAARRQIGGLRFIHSGDERAQLAAVADGIRDTAGFLADQGEIPAARPAEEYAAATRPELWEAPPATAADHSETKEQKP
jgi:taurine transport system substrate-binding protein